MAMNRRCASGGVGRKRVSSRRSPAMVRTRKASHQGTAAARPALASQARPPISQQAAPSARTMVNGAVRRRRTCRLAASITAAASSASACAAATGAPAIRQRPPRPAAAGAA